MKHNEFDNFIKSQFDDYKSKLEISKEIMWKSISKNIVHKSFINYLVSKTTAKLLITSGIMAFPFIKDIENIDDSQNIKQNSQIELHSYNSILIKQHAEQTINTLTLKAEINNKNNVSETHQIIKKSKEKNENSIENINTSTQINETQQNLTEPAKIENNIQPTNIQKTPQPKSTQIVIQDSLIKIKRVRRK